MFISTTKPIFLFSPSVIHLYICCNTLSEDSVLFIKITRSHKFNVIPNVSILPARRIKPNLPLLFASVSFLLISSLISFANSLLLRFIHNILYFLRILSSSINFSKHKEI